jgi:glutathione S-transferase
MLRGPAMTAVLHAIPASHPCAAVERALQLKGIPYRRVEQIPALSRLQQRVRFGSSTVPAVRFADGARVAGSRALMRTLDERVPDPPLLPPPGDESRAAVERAELWGEEVLQPLVRRILWAGLRRAPAAVQTYSEGARLPVPRPVARASAPLVAAVAARMNGAADLTVRADLIGLPTHLARIDRWVAEGVVGGAAPNAADLQIAASLRLLMTVEDLRPRIAARPAGTLAMQWFRSYPGSTPPGTLPRAWLDA